MTAIESCFAQLNTSYGIMLVINNNRKSKQCSITIKKFLIISNVNYPDYKA